MADDPGPDRDRRPLRRLTVGAAVAVLAILLPLVIWLTRPDAPTALGAPPLAEIGRAHV